MTMPNFFIIGVQKAGTTSLYHYLNQHPQVYMSSVKEPMFFSRKLDPRGEVVTEKFEGPHRQRGAKFSSIEEYQALFRGVKDEETVGEASPLYIYAPGTAERIKEYAPEAKVIALLRNPADRAYSSFLHARRIGVEPLTDFTQALREEEERVRGNWAYVFHHHTRGFYYPQLKPYYDLFGRDRVGVWLYEDLRDDPAGVTQAVFRFLGVDDSFLPNTSSRHNPAGVPGGAAARTAVKAIDAIASAFLETFTSTSRIYPILSKIRQRVQGQILTKPSRIDPKVRSELLETYREDILKLEELIERDLSLWLKEEDRNQRQGSERLGGFRAMDPVRWDSAR